MVFITKPERLQTILNGEFKRKAITSSSSSSFLFANKHNHSIRKNNNQATRKKHYTYQSWSPKCSS